MKRFVVGVLVGAGAVLLYAPASGTATRNRIVCKATALRDDANDAAGRLRYRIGQRRSAGSGLVGEWAGGHEEVRD